MAQGNPLIEVQGLKKYFGEVHALEDISETIYEGEVVAVITTDAEGVAVTPVLTWGIYEIRETTVPDGYLDSGCVVTVSIPGNAD